MASSRIIVLPICSICQDEDAGTEIIVTSCGHVFHLACMRTWDENQLGRRLAMKCPACNVTLRRATASAPARFIHLHSLTERDINDQGFSQVLSQNVDASADPRFKRCQEELNTLKSTLKERDARIQQLAIEPTELRRQTLNLHATVDSLTNYKLELEDRTAKCTRDLRNERKDRQDERNTRLAQEMKLKTELDKLHEKYQILKNEGQQMHDQYLRKVLENDELQSYVSDFNEEKSKLLASEASLKAQLNDSHEKFKSVKTANSVYKTKLEEARKRNAWLEERLETVGKLGYPADTSTQSHKRASRDSTHRLSTDLSKRLCSTTKSVLPHGCREPLTPYPIEIKSSSIEPDDCGVVPSASSPLPSSSPFHQSADHDLFMPSLLGKSSHSAQNSSTLFNLPQPLKPLQSSSSTSASASGTTTINFSKKSGKVLALGPKIKHK
ncbi:hypothetical protein, variant [Puccinia striiformis f. sp. tritici PST-78]|uniref:RING-type domain-containing protein n=1 Tax=Puccinia striiformis f. sp. tritici PST-78 TaxID=1165861 RepID=A0A0L0V0Y8_9BASI|nr:hypothetical protein, variant [Puccinia striiformis f. sp. tritici PST-78]